MKLKHGKYKSARLGPSKFLQICCAECGAVMYWYQKDGAGDLRRLYLDRMSSPSVVFSGKALQCPAGHLLGMKTVYAGESRPAFRLIAGAFKKVLVKSP